MDPQTKLYIATGIFYLFGFVFIIIGFRRLNHAKRVKASVLDLKRLDTQLHDDIVKALSDETDLATVEKLLPEIETRAVTVANSYSLIVKELQGYFGDIDLDRLNEKFRSKLDDHINAIKIRIHNRRREATKS